ncbi:hypothetical protein POJ06DRAFT_45500 [Lipomyces tetrasporus]|uniref:E3 ubiquitin-protein ligase PEP5 n=1 Tax=Lipomyces tetrasporus TaxID=54092 RepID=A0AAD7QL11_9ASCO|nr:uncharacterized protein POJ06DRAFT_45500 [Lipomyces tetrasporus]KAJ8096870.1 hypothetical protein POJ06DRAFT_45500 [Lipomyces tetrasporus]
MALAAWRQFTFFDALPIRDPAVADDDGPLYSDPNVSAVCAGSGSLYLATNKGVVKIVSRSLKLQVSFVAHDSGGAITYMEQLDGTPNLITVAETENSEPQVRLWSLDKPDKKATGPKCNASITINMKKIWEITAFAVSDDLSAIALGLANGNVILVRGDLLNDKGLKQKVIFESSDPVTGLAFYEASKTSLLYIATTTRILTIFTSGKSQGLPARVLEDKGCGSGCMALKKPTGEILVARDDAIYFYTPYGRGPCYMYDGPKDSIFVYKSYCAVVSLSAASSDASVQSSLRRFVGSVPSRDDPFGTTKFTILDTENKFVAYTGHFVDGVKAIFAEWGDLYVLGGDGQLYRHQERDLQSKLDILYQRNLYSLALTLAVNAGADDKRVLVIYKKYGDYLYDKGEYDEAMGQYIKAIDGGEASQVIRKYLDSQRIYNLTSYLEELHNRGIATADHTTLLLNCYAKLKDTEKLETFIKSEGENLKFDLDTAIQMCRQGGYFQQAAYLAEKHGQNDLVVDITLQDLGDYRSGLRFIRSLPAEDMYYNLTRYGRVLLQHVPKETTSLFIDYFTGRYSPRKIVNVAEFDPSAAAALGNEQQGPTSPMLGFPNYKNLIPYTTGSRPASVISGPIVEPAPTIMSTITNNVGKLSSAVVGGVLPSSRASVVNAPGTADAAVIVSDAVIPDYKVPKPRTVFATFVDQPEELIVFLEACIAHHRVVGGQASDEADMYTTLFEMYLQRAEASATEDEKNKWEEKSKELITGFNAPIDQSNVLLLSHLYSFRDGRILVRERENLYIDIFRSSVAVSDTLGAIQTLHKYGDEEPELYPLALSYFTSSPEVMAVASDELSQVLNKIEQEGLMAPLQVIQALSVNAVATVGIVKGYLSEIIEREKKEIETNRRLTESYRQETRAKLDEIRELETEPRVFQSTRCASCGAPLDLPTVHFMCKHSYHRRCLNEVNEDTECPQCAPNNATIRAIRRAQDDMADRHDLFKTALEEGDDKFKVVSDFFGRGVMEQVDYLVE